MTASKLFNAMETLVDFEAQATSGDEFAELYGWKDRDSLRDYERQFFNELWRVAFAHGRSQGQVDGVAYKSERTTELARENTDLQNKLSEADALSAVQAMTIEDLQKRNDEKVAEASRLEGKVYELQGQLREAASGLRLQREEVEDLKEKVLALVDRNMKRLSYRAWHKVMTVADERMSKAHP